jgi:hypothetical protein
VTPDFNVALFVYPDEATVRQAYPLEFVRGYFTRLDHAHQGVARHLNKTHGVASFRCGVANPMKTVTPPFADCDRREARLQICSLQFGGKFLLEGHEGVGGDFLCPD